MQRIRTQLNACIPSKGKTFSFLEIHSTCHFATEKDKDYPVVEKRGLVS